jgi:predicted Fe-Mo cluster-binding NifX family protein
MKVAIPVDNNAIETPVCQTLARAPYYLIHDTETGITSFFENSAADSQGGAGVKAAQLLVDLGVDALLTPRCGENAAEILTIAKMKIYKTIFELAQDNLNALKEDKLPVLDKFHPGFHGHGGQ